MNRLQWTCALGTGFEFFEFQLFALFMPIWVEHFFNASTALSDRYLISYLLFSVAFVARLIGAVGLGFFADHLGRRRALFTAMLIMALSTGLIALLPDYAQVGRWALLWLLFCRVGQGLSLGGEFAIGGVLLFENQHKPRCFSLIWQDLGGSLGLFFATLLVTVFQTVLHASEYAHAWRYPFFVAFIISLGVMSLRATVPDPALQHGHLQQNQQPSSRDYYRTMASHWRAIGLLIGACAPNGIFWYLNIVYIPNQLITLAPGTMLALIALTCAAIPVGAWCADRYGAYRVWMSSVLFLVINFNGLILSAQPAYIYLGLVLQALLLALNQGPRLLIMNRHFPLAVRALCCSLVYSAANLFGGLAPYVSLWLFDTTHNNLMLGQVLIAVGSVALCAMWRLRAHKTANTLENFKRTP